MTATQLMTRTFPGASPSRQFNVRLEDGRDILARGEDMVDAIRDAQRLGPVLCARGDAMDLVGMNGGAK